MRARTVALSILSSVAVLAIGWELGTQVQPPGAAPLATSAPSTASGPDASSPASPGAIAPSPAGVSGTFTGASVATRFGNVQVKVTVTNGAITDVTALHLTDRDPRSRSISNRAAPVLRREVLAAQSADVQGVSGATYTSDGYLSSLQSALDRAGL